MNENQHIPNGASGYYLLGLVLEKQLKKHHAIDCYLKAVQMQPTLWCAFEKLMKLLGGPLSNDGKVDANQIFTS